MSELWTGCLNLGHTTLFVLLLWKFIIDYYDLLIYRPKVKLNALLNIFGEGGEPDFLAPPHPSTRATPLYQCNLRPKVVDNAYLESSNSIYIGAYHGHF